MMFRVLKTTEKTYIGAMLPEWQYTLRIMQSKFKQTKPKVLLSLERVNVATFMQMRCARVLSIN